MLVDNAYYKYYLFIYLFNSKINIKNYITFSSETSEIL